MEQLCSLVPQNTIFCTKCTKGSRVFSYSPHSLWHSNELSIHLTQTILHIHCSDANHTFVSFSQLWQQSDEFMLNLLYRPNVLSKWMSFNWTACWIHQDLSPHIPPGKEMDKKRETSKSEYLLLSVQKCSIQLGFGETVLSGKSQCAKIVILRWRGTRWWRGRWRTALGGRRGLHLGLVVLLQFGSHLQGPLV